MTARSLLAFTLPLLAGGFAVAARVSAQEPASCGEIGLPATCHSCLHAVAGPFMDIGAQAHDASFLFNAVDQPHTYYRVTLMASTTVGPFAGAALYFPNNDEPIEFAFYRASNYVVRVFDDQGAEVLPIRAFTIDPSRTDCTTIGYPPTFDCASRLPYADVFLLDAVQHTVRFEAATEATIGVVIENLGSIGGTYYPDADNDGHGAYDRSLSTWCTPPSGYLDDSSDCNDANASVHDGAGEACNGIDDDCDEFVDEVECATLDAGMDAAADAASEAHDAGGDASIDPGVDAALDPGEPDSGTGVPDAAIVVDASVEPDAAIATDSSVNDSGRDASVPGGKPSSDGCSCTLIAPPMHTSRTGLLHVFGWIALGAWRLRRRRTGRQQ